MSFSATAKTATASSETPGGGRLGLALFVIAAAQLMVVLDNTIMNIALPNIQSDLGVSSSSLAWIVNAYALAFGGLLLLGGRAGDLFGRLRMFRMGIAAFTLASLLGGLAPNEGLLIAARIIQGVSAAIAAPAALSLVATTFPEGKPRNTAMGVYAGMAGIGSTVGLLLGGVLTSYLDWRWVFFINIPIGLAVLAGTRVLSDGDRNRGRLDVPGAITGTTGLVALVYTIVRGGESGWTDTLTIGSGTAAAVLLAAFLAIQARTTNPMMPLRLWKDRNRAGSYTTMLFVGAGMFATFYFLTLYMQQILGYSPIKTGLAYLPFSLGMAMAAGVSSKLVARFAPRAVIAPGLLIATGGMVWMHTLTPTSGFATALMPAMFITAFGLGVTFVPLTLGAVSGVTDQDTGITSALLNAAQQIGGALGLAVLTTISTNAANTRLPHAADSFHNALTTREIGLVHKAGAALTHGYTTAFLVAAALFIGGLVITMITINARKQQTGTAPAGENSPVGAAETGL
ncbi:MULTISPECIES: MFS transporter [unclassified Streptomyces]|uniref:MFS transporter n=1 Tax=Streptomyces sp. NPDC127532 TaxID=3345399 RepID=UPI0036411E4C